jgi:cell division protein ZapA
MTDTVIIRILDREYQVHCPPEEQDALIKSSRVLDQRMRDIRKSGQVIGLERIAVMAALNLTYDLLRAQGQAADTEILDREIKRLNDKLDSALDGLKQPEL